MELNDKVKSWIEISDYDLETANAMLKTKRYLYIGFMCHQAIEKILKGYYELKRNEEPPYTHNLIYLTEKQKDFLGKLQPLNIRARYPIYKEKLFKELTKEICEDILKETKEFITWIKKKLSV
jgi:HEPN domain-containing protein